MLFRVSMEETPKYRWPQVGQLTLDAFIIGTATVLSIVPLEIDGLDPVSIVFARAAAGAAIGAAQLLCNRLWFWGILAEE
jgi:hypothetical protein